jgi:DNA transformation protein and related proteins
MTKRPVAKGRNREATKSRRSLRVSDGFRSFVIDQLEPLGPIVAKSMFGGVGLYCDGVFFGLIALDVLYLKVAATNRCDYEVAGSRPFRPFPDRAGSMQYYAVPVGVLESQADLVEWARKAVTVARTRPLKTKGRH